jgi:VWFA-related protein
MGRLRLVALVPAIGAAALLAQERPRQLPPAQASTVLVDVVVRDGKGRSVDGLAMTDFELREDGVLQVVERFAPPSAGAATADDASKPANTPATSRGAGPTNTAGSTIALVFDSLSTESRVAAQRAARELLRDRRAGDVFGVFSVEETLVVLQDFTSDDVRLQSAIDALGTRAAQSGPGRLDQARDATGRRLAANAARAQLIETPNPSNAAEGVARAQAQITAAQQSMAQAIADAFEHLARDAQGYATAQALTAIVDALRGVPGRKAVALFSEGLFRTEANEERFLSVVHAANRAMVSVYAIEAAGLQTRSLESLAREEIVSNANVSLAMQASGRDTGGGALTRGLEATEDVVRFSPRASLEWLSNATGGVFVRDTNDLSGALRRIASDLGSFYVLGYTPRNDSYDGRFRKIAVKVRRAGLEVHARSGYFAVRSSGPVLAHVAPALALLEAGKRPGAIEVHAGAWPFPTGSGRVRVPVAVTVPPEGLARLVASGRKGRLDVTLLARIVGADGRPLEAMSRRFTLDPRGLAPGADLCLLRDAWLPPGRYSLEAVAYEATSGRAGVTTSEIEVEAGLRPLDRMQLVVVRRALPASDAATELDAGHPLRFGEAVLQPLAGEALDARASQPLVFQLASAEPATVPLATVELWRGARRLTTSRVAWQARASGPVLRHVGELPTSALAAGRYELRVTLTDGADERVLRAPFVVAERARVER